MLELRSITKSFDEAITAVAELSLEIAEGEIVCLLGPSGCGKTTLLRIIAGLERADAGEVWFKGERIEGVAPHERGFGMMFQDFALFPHKNVFENIAFGLRMRGDAKEKILKQVQLMLERVDLTGYGKREISQLSGGEQQRVALARALATAPHLLMLDEPLGALDRALRERLMLDLHHILKRVGVTAVYVTHDQTEAFAVADRIVVMNRGRIEQIDAPQALYVKPKTPFVARFLGFHNLLTGEATAAEVITPCGPITMDIPLAVQGKKVTILIKPDAARIGQGEAGWQGTVEAISFRGRYYQVWIQVNNQSLKLELASIDHLEIGKLVEFQLDPSKVLII